MSSHDATGDTSKFCTSCQKSKPVDDFWRWSRSPSGRQNFCKACCRARKRFVKYGLTMDKAATMLEAQGGTCAICPTALDDSFHVDHDHTTGLIRALLCPACNKGLGHFNDDLALIEAAAQYLRRFQQ